MAETASSTEGPAEVPNFRIGTSIVLSSDREGKSRDAVLSSIRIKGIS